MGTQNVAIPETKIPLSNFIKMNNGKPTLDIDKLLELTQEETGSNFVTAAYQQVINKINTEMQAASKVEVLNLKIQLQL